MTRDRRCCPWALVGVVLLLVCFVPGCKMDSESASAAIKRGNELSDQGDLDAGIAAYNKAIRLDPNNSKGYACRAIAYYQKGDFNNAIADDTTVIRLDTKSAVGYAGRGFAYLKEKDFDQAIADFTEALRLKPKEAEARDEHAVDYHGRRGPTLVKVILTRQLPTTRRPSGSIKRSRRTIRSI